MATTSADRQQALEFKAGVFVLLGLVFIAVMAFKFGRLGQGLFQHYYPLNVTFPSADGLIKNSDVQLAGARIGYVAEKPQITPGGSSVTLPLMILSEVKIPRETTFEIGSSGLLGDKFVDIAPDKTFDPKKFNSADPAQVLAPGEMVEGSPAGGLLGALQTKGEAVFDELKVEIKELEVVTSNVKVLTDKVNTGILSDQNQQNITATFANLKGTTEHFDVASKDLDAVVGDAKTTLGTVNAAAGDVHIAIDAAQKTLDTARELLAKAQTGNGAIATLLNDPTLSQNLKALVANLREHGILFYKDQAATAAKPKAAVQAAH
jgi:phospholipid/cholesterol/gamma-HCH transport system substrate-binding protein